MLATLSTFHKLPSRIYSDSHIRCGQGSWVPPTWPSGKGRGPQALELDCWVQVLSQSLLGFAIFASIPCVSCFHPSNQEKACKWRSRLLSGAPGRAQSFMGSQKCKQDGYPLGRFVGQHKPQNEPKEVFPCFKITFMDWKSFFKKTYTLKKYINYSDTRGKKKGRKKRMQMAKSLWEERVFFKHEPTSRK